MIDLEALVKEYYPKIKEAGLTVETDEATAIEFIKRYPLDMLEDVGEEGILTFLLFSVQFSDAVHTDFEGLGYDDFLNILQNLSLGELSFNNVDINVSDKTIEKGSGTCEVSFQCNGESFNYAAKVNNDWFDTEFMTFVNTIIKKFGKEERLIVFGDANGIFITYKPQEFINKFKTFFPMMTIRIA